MDLNTYHEGLASRFDTERRSSSTRNTTFRSEEQGRTWNTRRPSSDDSESYICPIAIHNWKNGTKQKRPPSKGRPEDDTKRRSIATAPMRTENLFHVE